MKKFFSILVCFVLSMAFLTACSNKYADSPYLGTWTATSASSSGISISVQSALGGDMIFELEADGDCNLTIGDEKASGSWEESDDGFIVEDTFEFKVNGTQATMEYSGLTITFEQG